MIFVIDNYDSFTYNLVQYFGELDLVSIVLRNDQISVEEVEQMNPAGVVVSPGPCTPDEAGISVELVKKISGKIPILGVCLGHQSICQAFGGKIVRAGKVMHGKVSEIFHKRENLFENLDNPILATRYHSLIVQQESLPDCLDITAWTEDETIMGVKHREHETYGVQFHPESFLTPVGLDILRNFKSRCSAT